MKILQDCVAFSEYMNFTRQQLFITNFPGIHFLLSLTKVRKLIFSHTQLVQIVFQKSSIFLKLFDPIVLKVIVEKSRCEVSLLEQDTIENVS